MLEIINLSFDYQDRALFECINLQVHPGEILHVKGKNGAGKTTLLKLIAGLQKLFAGSIVFKNQNIESCLSCYQQQLCYIGHKTGISATLTVKENCYFDLHNSSSIRILELIQNFGLSEYTDTPCIQLSAGQKRQIALLRLWMTQASLWILDEPFVSLDNKSVSILISKLNDHCKRGGSAIITSHQNHAVQFVNYKELVL